MTDKPKNLAAVALARLARGIPKTYTPEERARRAEQMAKNSAGLWEKRRQRGTVHGKKQEAAGTSEKQEG